MQKTAKGQITLVSLADGSSTIFYITPNQSIQQIHTDGGGYTPDYTSAALTLTPHLKMGSTPVLNPKYTWYRGVVLNANKIGDSEYGNVDPLSTSKVVSSNGVLTINANLSGPQEVYTCAAEFTDPASNTICTAETQVVLSMITSGKDLVTLFLEPTKSTNDGVIEKLNYIDLDNLAVAYDATLRYGVDEKKNSDASSAVVYQWTIYDPDKNGFIGFKQNDALETGAVDANTANNYMNTVVYLIRNENYDPTQSASYPFVNGTLQNWHVKIVNNLIVLKADAIEAKETIRCNGVYYEKVGSTRSSNPNDKLGEDADIETVRDLTDPYQCVITATSLAFTSKLNAIKLTAHLIQNGEDVTSRVLPTFDWDGYTYDTGANGTYTAWDEYTLVAGSSDIYLPITGTESGNGVWLDGGTPGSGGTISNPDHVQPTGGTYNQNADEVTIYKSLVDSAANVECTLRW